MKVSTPISTSRIAFTFPFHMKVFITKMKPPAGWCVGSQGMWYLDSYEPTTTTITADLKNKVFVVHQRNGDLIENKKFTSEKCCDRLGWCVGGRGLVCSWRWGGFLGGCVANTTTTRSSLSDQVSTHNPRDKVWSDPWHWQCFWIIINNCWW